jgi:hypothetical protein
MSRWSKDCLIIAIILRSLIREKANSEAKGGRSLLPHERVIVLQGDVTIETIDASNDLKLVGAGERGGKHQRSSSDRNDGGVDHIVELIHKTQHVAITRSVEIEVVVFNAVFGDFDWGSVGIIMVEGFSYSNGTSSGSALMRTLDNGSITIISIMNNDFIFFIVV